MFCNTISAKHCLLVGAAGLALFGAYTDAQAKGFQTLLSFDGNVGGKKPLQSGVVRDASTGYLFGVTANGGDPDCSCGVVYQLAPDGTETVLHTFTNTNGDGFVPWGGVIRDKNGNLYGTTSRGGEGSYGA